MKVVPYTSTVGSLMYVMICTRLDICYAVGIVSRYQSNLRPEYQTVMKHIFKYLKRTRDYMLTYGVSNSNFMSKMDSKMSTSGYVFTIGGAVVSTTEAKQATVTKAAKEVVQLKKISWSWV